MNELKLIENELVPVYETSEGNKVVYGSELHEVLKVKSNYREWIKRRAIDIGAEEGDFTTVEISTVAGGTPKKEYIINLDTAKEMAMLERNAKGKQVRRYFIKVEKKYKAVSLAAQELSPQLQFLINVELEQKRQAEKLNEIDGKVNSIKDVVSLSPNDWRKDTTKLINTMSLNLGGYEHIKPIREESYRLLDERMGVSLNTRLTNKRRRMADEGICKSKRDKLNQLDVIADDKKLIEGYVAIIKEMAVRYGTSLAG